jgi:hypothetical protein
MKTQHPPESMNRETLHFFSIKGATHSPRP